MLVGLAIIAAVAAYTFLTPEPEPKVHSATYGYYSQESRVGELQFTSVTSVAAVMYEFEGDFAMNTTIGQVGATFYGEVGDFGNSVPRSTSLGRSYDDSSPPSTDTATFVGITLQMTFLLPPERWGGVHVAYSAHFTSMPPNALPKLNIEMTAIGREDVVVPSGTYQNCFVVNGTQPEMGLEATLWVTEQGIVPQTEITVAMGGTDPLTIAMKLEYHE